MSRVIVLAVTVALLAIPSVGSSRAVAAKPRCDGQKATMVGSDKSQTMFGTKGDDVIVARGGVDRIFAGAGDDVICAGPGNDIVDGGAGRDRIFGEAGNDEIKGARGKDLLDGGIGEDACYPAAGGDRVLRCEEADLAVTISAPARVADGAPIDIKVKIRNVGSKRSGLVQLTMQQVASAVTCGSDLSGSQQLDVSLWPGAFEEVSLSIATGCTRQSGADQHLQLTATASAVNPDDDPLNDSATARIDITAPGALPTPTPTPTPTPIPAG